MICIFQFDREGIVVGKTLIVIIVRILVCLNLDRFSIHEKANQSTQQNRLSKYCKVYRNHGASLVELSQFGNSWDPSSMLAQGDSLETCWKSVQGSPVCTLNKWTGS